MKSLILVKDIGRFAKPEGDTGIWGGHPKVPVATSFLPWTWSFFSFLGDDEVLCLKSSAGPSEQPVEET